MENETKRELITYCFKMPIFLRDFFQTIADNEQRDLSFIIRRILIKEKQEMEQQQLKDK